MFFGIGVVSDGLLTAATGSIHNTQFHSEAMESVIGSTAFAVRSALEIAKRTLGMLCRITGKGPRSLNIGEHLTVMRMRARIFIVIDIGTALVP